MRPYTDEELAIIRRVTDTASRDAATEAKSKDLDFSTLPEFWDGNGRRVTGDSTIRKHYETLRFHQISTEMLKAEGLRSGW